MNFTKKNDRLLPGLLVLYFLCATNVFAIENPTCGANNEVKGLSVKFVDQLNEVANKISDKPRDQAEAEFKALIGRYIKPGMTFSDANCLLSISGFTINTDPHHFPARDSVYDDFELATKILKKHFLSQMGLAIQLTPRKPNEFSIIGAIEIYYSIETP